MYPLLIGAAVAAVLSGIILAAVGVVGTSRPAGPPSRLRTRLVQAWVGQGTSTDRRLRQITIGLGVAATVVVWLFTAIPIAGIIAGLAVVGVPWLFTAGRAEQRAINKLEGLEAWTRRVTDLVRTGLGLNQAIILSTRDAPHAIAEELHELRAQLSAGVPILLALDRFAAALGDAASDEVIVALRLHATDRGQRLADVLSLISDNIAREVSMRREIWAARADPRLTTRFMTILSVIVFVFLFSNGTYMRPYATVLGQIVLAANTVVFAGLLVWIRKLSQPRITPRLLIAEAGKETPA